MKSAIRQAEGKNNLKYHGWAIERGPATTLAEGSMNERVARSLAHIEKSFSRILDTGVMLDIRGEDTKRIRVMSIELAKADTGNSSIAIRKLTLESGLSSALGNFEQLLLNLGGIISDPTAEVTTLQAMLDFVHIGRLREESGNGKK